MRLLSRTTTERARAVAERVTDPELPMLTLADLGVLRDVDVVGDSHVVVDITPTYSGCPAMAAMRDDLVRELGGAGFDRVEVRVSLDPAWTTDWIPAEAREKLRVYGIAPPGPVGAEPLIALGPTVRTVACPYCGSANTTRESEFGPTACKSLHVCHSCHQPFEHFKAF